MHHDLVIQMPLPLDLLLQRYEEMYTFDNEIISVITVITSALMSYLFHIKLTGL